MGISTLLQTPNPGFKVTTFFEVEYLMGAKLLYYYYSVLLLQKLRLQLQFPKVAGALYTR